MNPEKIKRNTALRRSVTINIRITPAMSKWLKQKDYSYTAILHEAIKELGFEE